MVLRPIGPPRVADLVVAPRIAGNVMKRLWIVAAIAVASITTEIKVGRAQENGIARSEADAFDVRMFTKPPGNKAYACFVRRYDPDHLARHPKQKVSAMKLLVSA